MEALLERINQLERLLATNQQQLDSLQQNTDKEKLSTLTRLVEVTAERDRLRAALLEQERPVENQATPPNLTPLPMAGAASIGPSTPVPRSPAARTVREVLPPQLSAQDYRPASPQFSLRNSPPFSPGMYTERSPGPSTDHVPTFEQILDAFLEDESSVHISASPARPVRGKRGSPSRLFGNDRESERFSKRQKAAEGEIDDSGLLGSEHRFPRAQALTPYKDWQGKPWNNGIDPFRASLKRDGVPEGVTGVRSGIPGVMNSDWKPGEKNISCSSCKLLGERQPSFQLVSSGC